MAGWGWIDLAMAAVVAVSVLVGLWRGLVFELMSLVGWLVAYLAAQLGGTSLGPYVPVGAPGSALHQGACFALAFVLALLVWALLSRLVRLVVHATPLSWPDRLLGGLFGCLRAGVLLLAVATVVALTPAERSASWQGSTGAAWARSGLLLLRPWLPDLLARPMSAADAAVLRSSPVPGP